MSQSIYTEGIEAATLTLTSGGASSNEALLKNRDLRVKAINKTGTGAIFIEIDYGANFTADYCVLGNIYSSLSMSYRVEKWTGSAWSILASASEVASNVNKLFPFTSTTATKYRVVLNSAGTSMTVQLGTIFLGSVYTFPVNYQFNNARNSFEYAEVKSDLMGYPYSHIANSDKKLDLKMNYHLTDSQLSSLETKMANADYVKPFFFSDSNIDTNLRLYKLQGGRLNVSNLSAGYFNVPFNITEL